MKVLLFVLIVLFLVYVYFLYKRDTVTNKSWDLNDDGIVVIENMLDDIEYIKNEVIKGSYKNVQSKIQSNTLFLNKIKNILGPSYEFQDYVWIIQKSAVHTCHRDNNGDFFNSGQQFPSYTILIYLEDMPSAFGFIPKSHKNRYKYSVNIIDPITHIPSKKGDVILFNANLIHVGTIDNKVDDHPRIQMKLTHKNDRNIIDYYENFHKVLNKENTIPKWMRKLQKDVSCRVPVLSDYTQKININSSRGSDNGANIGIFQKVFSSLYYGDSKFYDLPNAF
jgi:hypothetical protein